LAANIGNHAERAAVVASVLHFEVGTRALICGIEDGSGYQLGVSEDVGNIDRVLSSQFSVLSQIPQRNKVWARLLEWPLWRQRKLRQLVLVRVADDKTN